MDDYADYTVDELHAQKDEVDRQISMATVPIGLEDEAALQQTFLAIEIKQRGL